MGLWDVLKSAGNLAYSFVPQGVKNVIAPAVPLIADTLKGIAPSLSKEIEDVKNILVQSGDTKPEQKSAEQIIQQTIPMAQKAVSEVVSAVKKAKAKRKAKGKKMSVML